MWKCNKQLKKKDFSLFTTRYIGKKNETIAKDYLIQQGLTLISENYCCRKGEIDLIMQDKDQVVFVEVKFRKSAQYGSGFEVVTPAKQKKIIYAAQHYLHRYNLTETHSCRFDVISIHPEKSTQSPVIEWLTNAFSNG